MWFSKSKGDNRDFESEFNELTASIKNPPQERGPRDYELTDPEEYFRPPEPDPLPDIRNHKAISLILAFSLILILSGLGVAQIVLPIWGRIGFGLTILVCFGIGFYPRRK